MKVCSRESSFLHKLPKPSLTFPFFASKSGTEYCKGKPLGVESATQILINTFEAQFKRPLSRSEARMIMRAFASHGQLSYPDVTVYGRSIEPAQIERLVNEAIDHLDELFGKKQNEDDVK